ncbi:hypothetical protein ALP64_203624 [Pseudomonas syringae pv. actinidiae]|nr:hypothetical protein ALP64_203624 [Pseudomonas syringae pv. actinidiae]
MIVTLHVDHRRRAGNQVIQPGVGGSRLGFLVFDIADIEHETQHALHLPADQRLALNTKPEGFLRGVILHKAHAEQQWRAFVTQLGETAGQLLAVCRMNHCQPVLTRQALDPVGQAQTARQLRGQQDLVAGGHQLPPSGAEQPLKHGQPLDMVTVVLLGQAKQHRTCQCRTEVQPLTLTEVGCLLSRVIEAEHQPGFGNSVTTVRDEKTISVGEHTLQRPLIDAAAKPQLMGDIGIETVQRRTQSLSDLPQLRCRVRAVLAVDTPADTADLRQHQRHTRNAPQLRQLLQLFGHHRRQPFHAAHAHTLGHLPGEPQALLATASGAGLFHQVADIQQLQQPALAVRLHPAAGVQGVRVGALEVQIEHVPQPVMRYPFNDQRAVGQQQVHKPQGSEHRRCHTQSRKQLRADALYPPLFIEQQIKVGPNRIGLVGHRQGLRRRRRFTASQPPAQAILFKGQVAGSLGQSGWSANAGSHRCRAVSAAAIPGSVGSWDTGW